MIQRMMSSVALLVRILDIMITDATDINDQFKMNEGNNQFGLPMVDQVRMGNNSMVPQNVNVTHMPCHPSNLNMKMNQGDPLVRRTQLV